MKGININRIPEKKQINFLQLNFEKGKQTEIATMQKIKKYKFLKRIE